MCFSIPHRIVEFDYFGGDDEEEELTTEDIELYKSSLDFSFFAVNFGYSKKDYEDLTITDILFIFKAYESKVVFESSLNEKAVFNANYNLNRKKGSSFLKLWKKKSSKKVEKEKVKEDIEIAKENIKKEGNSWVKYILKKNGMIK